ncbi:hypothetical protein ACH5RR_036040 [Cinchona calisaya]|uniref:LisH domain-containing protein n=1 Tax=Cinchona calisaya TaxID=153742 RepID=A0ABD2Y219_9GENT
MESIAPEKIALIVARYLSDNNFTQTSSTFLLEVANLLSESSNEEVPKNCMNLEATLEEHMEGEIESF